MRDLFIGKRFLLYNIFLVDYFIVSILWDFLFIAGLWLLLIFIAVLIYEVFVLFGMGKFIEVERITEDRWDLNGENTIQYLFNHNFTTPHTIQLTDDLPYQLQIRGEAIDLRLLPHEEKSVTNVFTPKQRGNFQFGKTRIYLDGPFKLFKRRFLFNNDKQVKVYPSVTTMKKFELEAKALSPQTLGIKKHRRVGHSYEFEQIRNFHRGDEYRSINWKATSRVNQIMVNQFQDERAQPIYTLIDKSRNMRLPFNGLTLLDHAINTGLVLANLNLVKKDKAGLITFAHKIETSIGADNKSTQLKRILEALYAEEERLEEANFEGLYTFINRSLKNRSILFLFTNIETEFALERVLPLWRSINKKHMLIPIFFENTELSAYGHEKANDIGEVFLRHTANQLAFEKQLLINKVQAAGIMTIYTKPQDLIVNTVNKYLELKARGLA